MNRECVGTLLQRHQRVTKEVRNTKRVWEWVRARGVVGFLGGGEGGVGWGLGLNADAS